MMRLRMQQIVVLRSRFDFFQEYCNLLSRYVRDCFVSNIIYSYAMAIL